MGVKLKTFAIVLTREDPVYRPGDVISGHCIIELDGELSLNQLHIKLKGKAWTHWVTYDRPSRFNFTDNTFLEDNRMTKVHNEHYYCLDLSCIPGNDCPRILTTGYHSIPFHFPLPHSGLPSSFEGPLGYIRYYVKVFIEKNQLFALDKTIHQALRVIAPANVHLPVLSQPIQDNKYKLVGWFGNKKIILKCQTQRTGYNIGDVIAISCFIDNDSKETMTLKATLKQEVSYRANGRHNNSNHRLITTIGNTISGKCKQNEVIELRIPTTAPVVYKTCPIIAIDYIVVVYLDIPNTVDLQCLLPVILTDRMPSTLTQH